MNEPSQVEYSIPFDRCKKLICGVCPGCGGELEPIETVDNANNPTFWAGCLECSQFHWGVPSVVHAVAKHLVEKEHYRHYDHMNESDYGDGDQRIYYLRAQTRGACSIVSDVLRLYRHYEGSQ